MRIFLCCQQALRHHAVPAFGFWAPMLRNALVEAGHEVIEAPNCDWAEGLLPSDSPDHALWRERTWTRAIEYIKKAHKAQPIHLFLAYLFPHQIEPSAIEVIRKKGIPCVNFFCDNVREFRTPPKSFGIFDLNWVPELKAIDMYSKAGMPVFHAPMPCWIPPALRRSPENETYPPTFIGTRDRTREELFQTAIQAGLRLELRGRGWDKTSQEGVSRPPDRAKSLITLLQRQMHFVERNGLMAWFRRTLDGNAAPSHDFSSYTAPSPSADEYFHIIRECSVCIGVNRFPSWRYPNKTPPHYSRLRDLEAPMAGACYITEWTEGIEDLYEVGSEIEVFRTAEELAVKTTALVRDDARRRCMRQACQQRALSEHSATISINKLLGRLSLFPS